MAIEFQILDFLHPVGLFQTHNSLDRSQWYDPQELRDQQDQRLRVVIEHAATHVPFYQSLFARLKLNYRDIQGRTLKCFRFLIKRR